MSKQAFDVTIVLIGSDDTWPTLPDLMNGLMTNELIYYGENVTSHNGKPIIYLCRKDFNRGEAEQGKQS